MLVLVYVGAVMVLFLFVVMMLDINLEELRAGVDALRLVGGVVAGVLVFEIVSVVWTRAWASDVTMGARPKPADDSNTTELGKVLYTKYVYPFELAAMLLLVAIIAAIVADHAQAPGPQVQDICRSRWRCAPGSGAHRQGAGGEAPAAKRLDNRATGEAMIPLNWLLTLSGVLFAISVAGMFINRKNVILLLMCMELLLLSVNFNFVAFSRYLGDINGQVFVFFVLTVAAAESAIGLAILVVLFRERRTINVEDMSTLKG